MRAARLIRMVLLLQARREMTAAELAAELEVSERTVARDVEALSGAGVPVYADRGRTGGYRLLGGYRTRLTGIARSEAEALFLSGVPAALRELGLSSAASSARLKVSAALAPDLADVPADTAQRFHLDAPGWWHEPTAPPLLPQLAEAVWDDRRVRVRYLRKDAEVCRVLEPYGLVLKAGVWYVAARVEDAWRVYRADRFGAVEVDEERFVRTPEFDLAAFWAERAAAFARSLLRTRVELALSPAGVRRLPHVTDRTAAEEALAAGAVEESGWTSTVLWVESEEVALGQLLGLGPECEVLAPAELRARFATAARRSARLYSASPESADAAETSEDGPVGEGRAVS